MMVSVAATILPHVLMNTDNWQARSFKAVRVLTYSPIVIRALFRTLIYASTGMTGSADDPHKTTDPP